MEMDEYLKIVKRHTIKENKLRNGIIAFVSGGLLGAFAAVCNMFFINICNLSKVNSLSLILIIYIFISCLLTSMGKMDNIVEYFRCGIVIPITGFAHSVMSSILDYKYDGFITGIGANVFKLAGSVILYGIVSGFIFGIIKVIIYA